MAVLLAAGLLAAGCAGGASDTTASPSPVTETITGQFDSLRVADGFQVLVRSGGQPQATVTVAGIASDEVSAEVRDGTLELRTTSASVPPGVSLEAEVVVPRLSEVIASSGASVRLQSGLELGADEAHVDLTAGASFRGRVAADDLEVRLQAGAEAELSGSAVSANVVGAEAGVLAGADLTVRRAEVALSSSATAEITVADSLVVSLASGGELRYGGDPEITEKKVEPGTTLEPLAR